MNEQTSKKEVKRHANYKCTSCKLKRPRAEFSPAPTARGIAGVCGECLYLPRGSSGRIRIDHAPWRGEAPLNEVLQARFWPFVDVRGSDECWRWLKGKYTSYGYGTVCLSPAGPDRRAEYTHRVAWESKYGEIPDGMYVLHTCDNPVCSNPSHLFLGTHEDNMADKMDKDRQAKGSRMGQSKLTEAEVARIKQRLSSGATQTQLAEEYGVSTTTISNISLGKAWKHV